MKARMVQGSYLHWFVNCGLCVVVSVLLFACKVEHKSVGAGGGFDNRGEMMSSSPTNTEVQIRRDSTNTNSMSGISLPAELRSLIDGMSEGERRLAVSFLTNAATLGDYKQSAALLLDKLRTVTTVEELRNWTQERIRWSADMANDSTFWEGTDIAFEQIPEPLRSLAPTNLFVAAAVEKQPAPSHVVIAWGSGMGGFFGIIVGEPSFKPSSNWGYSTNWEDGIYVWHSDK
ncbi:MAG TPA: hypothetical protein PKA41_03790 [Verrucomicrobiota bacterium]|nr:hypothetical protein [Verrucomicrobiota bacterium]